LPPNVPAGSHAADFTDVHADIGDVPAAEMEEMYYAEHELNEEASCAR